MTHFFEWLGRVVMLVLAGMITLSIIGAIASIPSQSIETRFGTERRAQLEPDRWPEARPSGPAPIPEPRAAEPEPTPASFPQPKAAARPKTQVVAAAPEPRASVEQWLEAITYALLALTGLAALGIVLLWRAVQAWRRNADALEAIARRG